MAANSLPVILRRISPRVQDMCPFFRVCNSLDFRGVNSRPQIGCGFTTHETALRLHPKILPPSCGFQIYFFKLRDLFFQDRVNFLHELHPKADPVFTHPKQIARCPQNPFNITVWGSAPQLLAAFVKPRFEQPRNAGNVLITALRQDSRTQAIEPHMRQNCCQPAPMLVNY